LLFANIPFFFIDREKSAGKEVVARGALGVDLESESGYENNLLCLFLIRMFIGMGYFRKPVPIKIVEGRA